MLARPRARRLAKSPQRASQAVDWRELAECQGRAMKDADPWFPTALSEIDAYAIAKEICDACPVAGKCLDAAMAEEGARHALQRHGMFGGLKPEERFNLYQRQTRKAARDRKAA